MIDLDMLDRPRKWVTYDRYVECDNTAIFIYTMSLKLRFQRNIIEIGYQDTCSDQSCMDAVRHAMITS